VRVRVRVCNMCMRMYVHVY